MIKINNRKRLLVIVVLFVAIVISACHPVNEAVENTATQDFCDQLQSRICAVKDDYPAVVTVISDDGFYETGVNLSNLARKFSLHLTVAGYVRRMNLFLEEWKKIEQEGYIELISHTWNHIKINDEANLTEQELYKEYGEAKLYYEEHFTTPSFCLITPNNTTTQSGYDMFEKVGIIAVRQGIRGENSLFPEYGREPGQLLNLKTRGIGDAISTQERNAWIDKTIMSGSWLIEMWHNVVDVPDGKYQSILISEAEEHLQYMKLQQDAGNLWVASFTQAVSYIYQRDNCDLSAYKMNDEIMVSLIPNNDALPWDSFNVPLSVKVSLPDDWNAVELVSGEIEDTAEIFVKGEDGTVMISLYPSFEQVVMKKVA